MALERCPGCRARLAPDALSCPRCGCELGLVRQVEREAQAALARALRAWADGDLGQALVHARVAQGLQGDELARAVCAALTPSPTSVGEGWGGSSRQGCQFWEV